MLIASLLLFSCFESALGSLADTGKLRATGIASPTLELGFRTPPNSAKPHTWWHWMDGNVTREGITADLEAMKFAGIGGAQMFTVAVGIPKGPAGYMSDRWRELTAFAVREAGRLGIELCLHNCAGWSSSGGPWIKPEHAMQVLAWSETKVRGPGRYEKPLADPAAPQTYSKVSYSRDIAVLAFPTPEGVGAEPRDPRFLGKTGVVRQDGLEPELTDGSSKPGLRISGIRDLTGLFDAGRGLEWDVPEGEWTILRIGHVPTGKNNHPAPPEGDGLEVDKLSREALDAHWAGMMGKVIADVGPLAGSVLNNSLIDSYEVGSQNWTPRFREEFRKRRGYDLLRYLPAIAGFTVESKEATERFLWDFRRTIADLFAENYFGYFGELCRRAGMLFSTEPYGNGGFDNIECGGLADIPMGEFWVGGGAMESTKLASSIGHVYGRSIIGAESFTADDRVGRFQVEPYAIKALGDLVFCKGINRYIFHRYAHQPWMNLTPGMTMGPWGMHLERTATWWRHAPAWLEYVARCQFLLQQGLFVADVCYYTGEGAPVDLPYGASLKPALPAGYDYDGCDTRALLGRMSVRNGRIVLPDGMSYRLLILPNTTFMTPRVARKIRQLVAAGATVLGPKPERSPSLTDYPQCDRDVRSIADEVWGNREGDEKVDRRFGKGRVVWGKTPGQVLDSMHVEPDFRTSGFASTSRTAYIHRTIGGAEVYFVSNQRYAPSIVDCEFRVSGKAPELWRPETGRIEIAPVFRAERGRTVVPLRLAPAESVFVVFRSPAPKLHWSKFQSDASTPDPRGPRVVVKLARYEESATGRGADVTTIVREMAASGEYDIPATNGMFGDPVPNVVKQLRIEFEIDGRSKTVIEPENGTASLLQTPKAPTQQAPFGLSVDGELNLVFVPWASGRYVAKTNDGRARTIVAPKDAMSVGVSGTWKLYFPSGAGAPPSMRLTKLGSWSDHPSPGVKYFSGTATYTNSLTVPRSMAGPGRVVLLDLGRVKNFARVMVNGTDLGTLWKEPFVLDVSRTVRPGLNSVKIQVTNLWPNRLIGDEQLASDVEWNGSQLQGWPAWLADLSTRPKTGRVAFTTWRFYRKDSPLLESGLLGPVAFRSASPILIRLRK